MYEGYLYGYLKFLYRRSKYVWFELLEERYNDQYSNSVSNVRQLFRGYLPESQFFAARSQRENH